MLCCVSVNTRTPKARALGAALREAREETRISLRGFAARIKRDPGLLSRWETGERVPKATDVAEILTALGVNGERYDEIIGLAEGTEDSQWLAVTLPEQRRQLDAVLNFEQTATVITEVSPLLVPGLLQTNKYIRAIMSAGSVPPGEVASRITTRIGRRDVLTDDDPVRFVGLIGEAALRQMVGDRALMTEQLRYLATVAQQSNVDVRVIPFETGWHPALEGSFTLIDSAQDKPIVHIENRRSGLFLHEERDVNAYREAVDHIAEVAMDPTRSAEFIAEIINDMETT